MLQMDSTQNQFGFMLTILLIVQKGCLSHPCSDIASDRGHIEGSHKHWNSTRRTYTSGLSMVVTLCHNHVACYNIQCSRSPAAVGVNISEDFDISTHDSHHLVVNVACLWNRLLKMDRNKLTATDHHLWPMSKNINSKEQFGLVSLYHSTSFGRLLKFKEDPEAKVISRTRLLPLGDIDGVKFHREP